MFWFSLSAKKYSDHFHIIRQQNILRPFWEVLPFWKECKQNLALDSRLALNSQSTCLNLQDTGFKGECDAMPITNLSKFLILVILIFRYSALALNP